MVGSSLVLILVLTLALIAIIHWPVRESLERRDLNELRAYGTFIQSEVSGFLSEAEQLAKQIPSRTRIREELVAYLRGERTLESYVAFAQPKLADAVHASPRLVAVYRFDPRGNPAVGVNIEASQLPALQHIPEKTRLLPGSQRIDGHSAVFFAVPIQHEGFGLAGYDMVAISLRELSERTQRASERAEGAHIALASASENGPSVPVYSQRCPEEVRAAVGNRAEKGVRTKIDEGTVRPLRTADGTLVLALYGLRDNWVLGVSQPREVLFSASRAETRILVVAVLVVGVLAAGVAAIVLRTLSRRVVSDTSELARIIADQTQDLELLLREIHHRVKNDIALMTSFLALKASRTSAPEAEEALSEAQQSLQVMGRVYERLQEAGHYADAPLKPLLEGIAEDLSSASGTRHEMNYAVCDIVVPRRVAIPLGIMMNELVTNALKYGDTKKEVTVEACSNGDQHVQLYVASGGEGFPQRVLDGEYGFGLTMVEALAQQHQGQMKISNDPYPSVTVRIPVETKEGTSE